MSIAQNLDETKKIAQEFSKNHKNNILCFYGEIGAGKTTFIKAFLENKINNPEEIKSPTYNYIREYEGPKKIYHLDLYRVDPSDHLIQEEIKELFESDAIILVEWAEKIKQLLPEKRSDIHIKYLDKDQREIQINE